MSEASLNEVLERGVGAHRAGRMDEALACYRAAHAIAPHDAEVMSLMGLALLHSNQEVEALPLLAQAVQIEPEQIGFRLNLAEGFVRANRYDDALRELQVVAAAEPRNERAQRMARDIVVLRRDWPALHAMSLVWARADPFNVEAWRCLARAAFEQGRHAEACAAFERVLSIGDASAVNLAAYASLCLHALRIDAAAAALERAEALDSQYPEMLSTRALLLMYLGRFEEAESYCRRCLARDPQHAAAHTTLSRLRRGALQDEDLRQVEAISRREDLELDRRIPAAFAVAHAHDARDDADLAFAAYEYAHALALERDRLENRTYDRDDLERRAQQIREWSALTSSAERLPGAPNPIFIVGMPRSGTTLVESVLGAHSHVFACGERVTMRQILQALLDVSGAGRSPDSRMLRGWAQAYFAELPTLAAADHVTDKHPLNFEAAGLIPHLFADAVIVHVRRNPVDTCFSIYRQEFNKQWSFAHRLEDIAHYYGYYARLAVHWERTLPERFKTVQYEQFVAEFDVAAPALVRSCGLDWEPSCLNFQQTPRAIATFSTVQARAPVQLGPSRAKRYAAHLPALTCALERAGVDLETGALRA